jgi:hypothetical protein
MATSAQLLERSLRGETLLESEIQQLSRTLAEADAATKQVQGWLSGNGAPVDMSFRKAKFLASPSQSTTFTRPTDTAIVNNTATYITFEATYGTGFKLDPADATRILYDWSGSQILISGAPTWANNAVGYRATQLELYNGVGSLITTHTLHVSPPVTSADDTKPNFVVLMNTYLFKEISYVKVVVRQTSGGNLTLKDFYVTFSLI